jgi:uncharacterized phiE125 gp8 family phage protein
MALDTLANVKVLLGVSGTGDDTLLDALRANAEGFIASHCGRDFGGGTFTEDHPGGGRVVFLKNYPVAAVTAVKVDAARGFGAETVLDPARYFVHADRGVVEALDGPFVPGRAGVRVAGDGFPGAVRVEYTTATGAVPAAVLEAHAELIAHWFHQTKTHAALGQQLITSRYIDGAQLAYPWGLAAGLDVPPGVLRLLQAFRAPGV